MRLSEEQIQTLADGIYSLVSEFMKGELNIGQDDLGLHVHFHDENDPEYPHRWTGTCLSEKFSVWTFTNDGDPSKEIHHIVLAPRAIAGLIII